MAVVVFQRHHILGSRRGRKTQNISPCQRLNTNVLKKFV